MDSLQRVVAKLHGFQVATRSSTGKIASNLATWQSGLGYAPEQIKLRNFNDRPDARAAAFHWNRRVDHSAGGRKSSNRNAPWTFHDDVL